MKRKFSAGYAALCAALAAGAVLSGCATSIGVSVKKLPNFDMVNISRVAVVPFKSNVRDRSGGELAGYLTSRVTAITQATPLTLVDAAYVEGRNAADTVDGYITGEITGFDTPPVKKEFHEATEKRKAYTTYTRQVTVNFTYRVVRVRDGTTIGTASKSGTLSSSSIESEASLKSATALAKEIIDRQLSGLRRDIAYYTVTEYRTLMDETSKDKALKKRMKDINALVKNGSYKAAIDQYRQVYESSRSVAAGYNEAIMTEVIGDLDGAIALMQTLVDEEGNPKAMQELARMNRTRSEGQQVAEKYSDMSSPRDRAVRNAVSGISSKLKSGAVYVRNDTRGSNRQLAEYIVEGITTLIVQSGSLTVVDRESQRLIDAEQQFQASGAVSDADAVSIGNQLGVSTIILCSVTGEGSLRRLTIKAISVETGEVLYQKQEEI